MRVMALFHFNFCKMPACGWGWPWAGASVPYWHISSFFSCFCFFLVHCLFEKRFIWEVRSRVRMDNFTWNISCRTCNLSRNGRKRPFLSGAPNQDSNQPSQLRSLIRVFVVRMKTLCMLGYPKKRLVKIQIRMRKCAVWSESSHGVHIKRYVTWHCGSFPDLITVFSVIIRQHSLFTIHVHEMEQVNMTTYM